MTRNLIHPRYRLVAPGDKRLAERDTYEATFTTGAAAWATAARYVASDYPMDDTERLALVRRMLESDMTGTIEDWEVLRFAHTNVDISATIPSPAGERVHTELGKGGVAVARYGGVLEGTFATLTHTLLTDMLSDAESSGVEIRAQISLSELPEKLYEDVPRNAGDVWLLGIIHDLTPEGDAVFADGYRIDLSVATFIHAVY